MLSEKFNSYLYCGTVRHTRRIKKYANANNHLKKSIISWQYYCPEYNVFDKPYSIIALFDLILFQQFLHYQDKLADKKHPVSTKINQKKTLKFDLKNIDIIYFFIHIFASFIHIIGRCLNKILIP